MKTFVVIWFAIIFIVIAGFLYLKIAS
jgi:hypothetical protein